MMPVPLLSMPFQELKLVLLKLMPDEQA